MAVRVTPFNTQLTDIKPENGRREANTAGHGGRERRQAVYDRRQRESDRRRLHTELQARDDRTLAPILQELRNSFTFLHENEQADETQA